METVTIRVSAHIKHGASQCLVRCRLADLKDISKAAEIVGVSRSQFIRNILVQAARAIIAESASEAA